MRIAGQVPTELGSSPYDAGDGFERIYDTNPPHEATLTYRVDATDTSATCEGYFESPDGSGITAVGDQFTFHHPCDGSTGGPGPDIMPDPTDLRIIDGAGIGLPGADFVCGGVSPVILEALVARAVRVIEQTDAYVLVILPGDMLLDGTILDPALDDIGTMRVVDEIRVLDVGEAVIDLIVQAPQEAVVTLEGAGFEEMISIDPDIVDVLRQVPTELRRGRDLPVDDLGRPRP